MVIETENITLKVKMMTIFLIIILDGSFLLSGGNSLSPVSWKTLKIKTD